MATTERLKELYDDGTDDPIFVGPGMYAEIEQWVADTRRVVETLPDGTTLVEPHEWEADAVAPMVFGRPVMNRQWVKAPDADERARGELAGGQDPNAITEAEVLGVSSGFGGRDEL